MPVRKQDAYRALELLEEYYNRLDAPEDRELKHAIERVIKVFKSRLFQALVDIQEMYETILLDESRDRTSQTTAVLQYAVHLDKSRALVQDNKTVSTTNKEPPITDSLLTDNPIINPISATTRNPRQPTPTPFSQITNLPKSTSTQNNTTSNEVTDLSRFSYDDHWKEIKIDLQRPQGKGLGFSVAGGVDAPCFRDSSVVIVTRITEGGAAALDGRLRNHDILLRVNGNDFTNIAHQLAVDTLKSTPSPVNMIVRRLMPSSMEEIVLKKPPNSTMGFSIGGGINHEVVAGDFGIFITNIVPGSIAAQNQRLQIGDRLMSIQSEKNTYELEFIEHKTAVEFIHRACDESEEIKLFVAHPTIRSMKTQSLPTESSVALKPTKKDDVNEQSSISRDGHIDSHSERRVLLRRGTDGFGFRIIGLEGMPGVYISFIQAGGEADKSGELRKGDRILSVNNHDLREASHEEAGAILRASGENAHFVVIHRGDEFLQRQSQADAKQNGTANETSTYASNLKISARREFFVRAEFDYDPAKDSSLPSSPGIFFRAGDILHVVNAVDDSWWQARRVVDGREDELGIIPSKLRVEKKERIRQKRVNFNKTNKQVKSNAPDQEKKTKKKTGIFGKADKKDVVSAEDSENDSEILEPIPSYQLIVQHNIDYPRPVVLFGVLKELVVDQLMSDHPDHFANCVPHTTRPKRDNEIDGREYYFVSNRSQMERDIENLQFIEAGEYGGNLYGTSIAAVQEIINQNKHCILDISCRAVKRLPKIGFYPIVIFIKPRDVKWIMDNIETGVTDEAAKQLFDRCREIEQNYKDIFTKTIEEKDFNDVYDRILSVINTEDGVKAIWVPSDEKI